jgi:hypothetical protein
LRQYAVVPGLELHEEEQDEERRDPERETADVEQREQPVVRERTIETGERGHGGSFRRR